LRRNLRNSTCWIFLLVIVFAWVSTPLTEAKTYRINPLLSGVGLKDDAELVLAPNYRLDASVLPKTGERLIAKLGQAEFQSVKAHGYQHHTGKSGFFVSSRAILLFSVFYRISRTSSERDSAVTPG
jgi:hypothetical protein